MPLPATRRVTRQLPVGHYSPGPSRVSYRLSSESQLESSYARRIFTASGRNTTVTVTQWQTLEATQTESECATGTCTSCMLSLGRYMKSLSVGVSHRRPL